MVFMSIISLVVLFAMNMVRKKGDLLYPATIQTGIWLFVLIVYALNRGSFNYVDPSVFLIIQLSCMFFSIGCLLASGGAKRKIPIVLSEKYLISLDRVTTLLVLLSIIALFFVSKRAEEIVHGSDVVSAYFNLRNAINYGDPGDGYGILRYLFTLTYFAASCVMLNYIYRGNNRSKFKILAIIMICMVMVFLSTSRTQLLAFLLLLGMPLYYYGRIKLVSFVTALMLVFLPIFSVLGILLGKFSFDPDTMGETFSSYFVAPMVAFSGLLDTPINLSLGSHTFRFFLSLMHTLGIGEPPLPLIQSFSYVPIPTNLYTSFQPYYLDFGLIGIIGIQLILGLVHGIFYRLISVGEVTIVRVFLFIISLLPLFSIYSTETHFLQLSLWIQYAIFGLLFLIILPRLRICVGKTL